MSYLYSNNYSVKEVKTMTNNKKKKKGFTLIELIAVIAILGILAAIAVPNINGYTAKARRATALSDAKLIVNAVDAYNADNQNSTISDDKTIAYLETQKIIDQTDTTAVLKSVPAEYNGVQATMTVGGLRQIVAGTVPTSGDNFKTITGPLVTPATN